MIRIFIDEVEFTDPIGGVWVSDEEGILKISQRYLPRTEYDLRVFTEISIRNAPILPESIRLKAAWICDGAEPLEMIIVLAAIDHAYTARLSGVA